MGTSNLGNRLTQMGAIPVNPLDGMTLPRRGPPATASAGTFATADPAVARPSAGAR